MAKSPSLLDLLAMLPAGDIARTARSLGLSPDLLLKRLGAIESTLGVDLLGSATRALIPVDTGKVVLEHVGRSARGASRRKAAAKPRGRRKAR
jgi:DNA-binding transcriptional LysR family regulator